MKLSGIFFIKNIIENKFFISNSFNIQGKLEYYLTNYTEYNMPLYTDMCKYGLENFLFSIIEFCPQYLLNSEYLKWTKLYSKKHPVYPHNISKKIFILNYKGKPHIVLKKYETPLSNLYHYQDRNQWFNSIPIQDIPKECRSG